VRVVLQLRDLYCCVTLQVREGLYYNPYFPGGAIAMPKMLVDGGGLCGQSSQLV
jgi:hypothetical protein